MIITVTMNPAIDKTAEVDRIVVDGLNRLSNVKLDIAGKGINVSKTIKALGGESLAIAVVAGSSGDFIIKGLNALDIREKHLSIKGNTRTNLKVMNFKKSITELNEMGPSITEDELGKIRELIIENINKDDILVLAGSVLPNTPIDFYQKIIKIARSKGVKVILDADGELFRSGVEALPNVIKPNAYELKKYFNKEDSECSSDDLVNMAKVLISKGIELVMVSLGSKGALYIDKEVSYFMEGLVIDFKSATGAGDAMVASIALSLDRGESKEVLIKKALATSAGACMSYGTTPADLKTVQELEKQVTIKELK